MKERYWSEQEIETVRRMKAQGLKLSQIADHLGRSYDGVRGVSRRFAADRPACQKTVRPWSAREITYLETAASRGDTLGHVAGHLRRSQSSVKKFAWRRNLSLLADPERDRAKEQPVQWGLVPSHAMAREARWARCWFEDDPSAQRRELVLKPSEIGIAPLGAKRQEAVARSEPSLPALPSGARP